MKKPQANPFLSIKKPWVGGNGETVYLGIPSDIVKQLQISENTHLMIDLVDDSVIVIKKHNPQFTKSELSKIQQNYANDSKKRTTKEPTTDDDDDSNRITENKDYKNPLDRLDNL